MTRSEAIMRVQLHLGFRSDLITEITDALQDTQVKLEEAEFDLLAYDSQFHQYRLKIDSKLEGTQRAHLVELVHQA